MLFVVSEVTNSILTNQTSIRGGRQPIKNERDASENPTSEGVNERDATPSLKQTGQGRTQRTNCYGK